MVETLQKRVDDVHEQWKNAKGQKDRTELLERLDYLRGQVRIAQAIEEKNRLVAIAGKPLFNN